ncbi:MAG TPA: cytochrome P450 [Solirubrobacterales bacterium]|nr:cytochrome P450 [Solirubrobacterales bacterium]
MEQATIAHPPLGTGSGAPPGSRAPSLLQALRYVRDPLSFLVGLQRRYGDIFTLSFPFFGRLVYVADPALVKAMFTGSPERFHAGEANATVLGPALGPNSVLTLDDAPHMQQRKLLLPPFHGERVRGYGELIQATTRKQMETWPVGEPFALRPHTQRITLAVIMRAVFGVHDEARLARFERLIDDFARRVGVITSFPMLRRNFGPGSPWPRFLRSREALDAFIYEEIKLRRAEPGHEERDDVLSLLLEARDEDGKAMSDQELRDELVTVLGAGHETTATGLAWAVELLNHNPAVLAKLRDSLAAGKEDYLGATVKEVLRARPVLVDVGRKLTSPATIGGYELPEGSFVLAAIAALHYREDAFPEPYEFRPERFLDARVDNYAWIPFGGGVRRCIGAAFAEYEMRTILREFVERTELRPASPKPEKVRVRNITLAPAKNTRVVLERRLA